MPAAATAIAAIAPTPPKRLLVEVLVGATDGAMDPFTPDSTEDGLSAGVCTWDKLAVAAGEAGAVVAAGGACVVCPAATVVAARVAVVARAVVAGATVGGCVVAVCLGGTAPGATYPAPTGSYRQPSASLTVGWYELGPTLEYDQPE